MQHSHSFQHLGNTVQVFSSRIRQHHQLKNGTAVAISSKPISTTKPNLSIRLVESPLDAPSVELSNSKDGFITVGTPPAPNTSGPYGARTFPTTKANLDDIFEPELDEMHQLFDDSAYSDCGFIAMAEHTSEMNSLERIISESCYAPKNGGKVTHPRLVLSDGLTKYFRSEYIAKRLQCNSTTAERFILDWQRLSLTGEIIEKIIRGIQKKNSLASASLYFTRLASQMPDPDLEDHYSTMDLIQGSLEESSDETDDEFILHQEDLEHEAVPNSYSFIPIGETGEKIAPDVLTSKYRRLIRELRLTYDYGKTKALCTRAFKSGLSNLETSMFLIAYRNHKAAVIEFWTRSDKVYAKIAGHLDRAEEKDLPKAGNWLAKLAAGKVKVEGYIPREPLTAILKDKYFELKNPKPAPTDLVNLPAERLGSKVCRDKVDIKTVPSAFQLDLPEPYEKPKRKRTLPVVQAINY